MPDREDTILRQPWHLHPRLTTKTGIYTQGHSHDSSVYRQDHGHNPRVYTWDCSHNAGVYTPSQYQQLPR